METFLLLLILIVMLGALGWLPGVIRVVLVLAITVGAVLALVLWLGNRMPPEKSSYDTYYKELNDKIYTETKDRRISHDHVRR